MPLRNESEPRPGGRTATSSWAPARLGRGAALALAALAALAAAHLAVAERVVAREPVAVGAAAAHTIRVPIFGPRARLAGGPIGEGAVVLARGEVATTPAIAAAAEAARRRGPASAPAWIAFALALALGFALHGVALRGAARGRLVRTHVVVVGVTLLGVALAKAALLATPVSILALPVGALGLAVAGALGRRAGLATAGLGAALLAAMVPFDVGVVALLALQGAVAVLAGGRGRVGAGRALAAGGAAALASALAYPLVHALAWGHLPLAELDAPLRSTWLAAAIGGALVGPVAVLAAPVLGALLGEVGRRRLARLDALDHPLLLPLADKAPGSWQHSLALATMAEAAARAIGADARLVKVGAYLHDVGKAIEPRCYPENVAAGEASPLDHLPPAEAEARRLEHVAEGVKLARRAGVPARLVEFIYMHHGEVPPQGRETAILLIADALEPATRGLHHPRVDEIRAQVERAAYGALQAGQLDDSGLTAAELRRVVDALVETLRRAHDDAEVKKERTPLFATPIERPASAARPAAAPPSPLSPLARSPLARPDDAHRIETAPTQPIEDLTPLPEPVVPEESGPTEWLRAPKPAAVVVDEPPSTGVHVIRRAGATGDSGRHVLDPRPSRDVTVQRKMPLPDEAVPEERRATAERPTSLPDEALPGEVTAPASPADFEDPILRGRPTIPDDER